MKNLHAQVCIFKQVDSDETERGIIVGSDNHDRIVIVDAAGLVVKGPVYFVEPLPNEGCIVTLV